MQKLIKRWIENILYFNNIKAKNVKHNDINLCYIISAPRSGSTWLRNMLDTHPDIMCTEHKLYGDYFDVFNNTDGTLRLRVNLDHYIKLLSDHSETNSLGLTKERHAELLFKSISNKIYEIDYEFSGNKYIFEKITPFFGSFDKVIDGIQLNRPESEIVHLIRDGRDVSVSGVFDWLKKFNLEEADNRQRLRYSKFISRKNVMLERFFTDDEITRWAQTWTEACSKLLYACYPIVRYEMLLDNPRSELKTIMQYTGLRASNTILEK